MREGELRVNRNTELPLADLRGRFIVTEPLLSHTKLALVDFALQGIRDGGHEGLVFWAGRETDYGAVFTTVIVPPAEHSHGRVMVGEEAVGQASRKARGLGLGILCQVHSHPGRNTRHSEGDDDLILLPFEGMLSLIAPYFGIHLRSFEDFSVHQFQNRRWVLCRPKSVREQFGVVPSMEDLR